MLSNFFKTAFRSFLRHKSQASINILGLSVGLACSFLIVVWVQDELSYDQFHEDKDQLYRAMLNSTFGGDVRTQSSVPKPLDDVLVAEYPEITNTVLMSWPWQMMVEHEGEIFRATGRYFGADLFNIFTFPLALGDPQTALENPDAIVISATLAERFYGPDWATQPDLIGTIMRIDNPNHDDEERRRDVVLTGVFDDIPANSSLQFEFALPVEAYNRVNDWVEEWDNTGLRMFVKLDETADPAVVAAKIKDRIDPHVESFDSDLFLQPITDWYLKSDYENGVLVGGRIDYVRIFIIVAIFLIVIASINFMNLATARSQQRAREIGVRKSVGASKTLLARQFLGESVLMAALAFVVAGIAVVAVVPSFDTLTGKSMMSALFKPDLWLLFGGMALLTGLVAGSYPALYLSSFSVVGVLKGEVGGLKRGSTLRKGLVVFQFVLSIILIVGTLVVHQQLDFIRSKDLGLDRENVVFFEFEGEVEDSFDAFKAEAMRKGGIVSMATTDQNPLSIGRGTIGVQWEGKDPDDNTNFANMSVGLGFPETVGMRLKDGRFFDETFGLDSVAFVVNEKAAAAMGMEDPVGQTITFWGTDGPIIGLAEDFHMSSLYEPIRPVIVRYRPQVTWQIFARIEAGQTDQGLATLEETYNAFFPGFPFTYRFMDAEFEETYRSEVVIGTLSNVFAVLAILVACLGLFGLASFTAEQRTKEIGVRKVLGASIPSVVGLLSKEFVLLVGAAFAVAGPLSYFLMDQWLSDFEYRTDLGIGMLLLAGLMSLVIAWITVSYQSIKVATANPVVALRSE